MSEQVQTGGAMKFDYSGQKNSNALDPERKDAIEIGYVEYGERKKKEFKNKIILWLAIFIILLIILGYFLLKN